MFALAQVLPHHPDCDAGSVQRWRYDCPVQGQGRCLTHPQHLEPKGHLRHWNRLWPLPHALHMGMSCLQCLQLTSLTLCMHGCGSTLEGYTEVVGSPTLHAQIAHIINTVWHRMAPKNARRWPKIQGVRKKFKVLAVQSKESSPPPLSWAYLLAKALIKFLKHCNVLLCRCCTM